MVSVRLPSDASCNTYRLTWVSLTLDVGYLFMAAPANCSRSSLPWMRGISSLAAPPDLERGVAPLGPLAPMQPLLLEHWSVQVGLKLNIQKTKIMASGPITSWEIDGERVETVSDFIFGGLQNHCRW